MTFRLIIIHTWFLCSFGFFSFSQQQFHNEWLRPNETYLKVTINQDGVYRITGNELQKAGLALSEINKSKLAIYHYGKKVSLLISGSATSAFTATDYIEFFAEKNKGNQDSLLYRPTTARANPYYSMFSDETTYFIALSDENLKTTVQTAPENTGTVLPYHLAKQTTVFTSQFSFNNIIGLVPYLQQSYYEKGEGRTGAYIEGDSVANHTISFVERVKTADVQPVVSMRLNGRSRIAHQLVATFQQNEKVDTLTFGPFDTFDYARNINENMIANEATAFNVKFIGKKDLDWYSFTYITATYPQRFSMLGNTERIFYLPQNSSKSFVKINDLTSDYFIYDITDTYQPKKLLANSKLTFEVTTAASPIIFVTNQYKQAKAITKLVFQDYLASESNYQLITQPSLAVSANEFAAYRGSDIGGKYKVQVVYMDDLYNQFSYGEKTPLAIRRYAAYIGSKYPNQHLLLLGKTTTFPDELRTNRYPDLVPSMGYPGSDVLLTAGLLGFQEDVPAFPTGRLSVTKNEEVTNYLAKVKDFELHEGNRLWQKRILHISGGQTVSEINQLKSILESAEPSIENGVLGGQITHYVKPSTEEVVKLSIADEVNKGVGMISFAGHGSATIIDYDFGFASPTQNGYTNKGMYPIMYFNGCGVGNIFYRYSPLSTDWLLAKDKGAIAVFANSFWSFAYPTEQYIQTLYKKMFVEASTTTATLGQIQQQALVSLSKDAADDYIRADMQQVVLQGDPALKIFPTALPDYLFPKNAVVIKGENESLPIGHNDSLQIGLIIQNAGRFSPSEKVPVAIRYLTNSTETGKFSFTFDGIAYQDTLFFTLPSLKNANVVEVLIDEKNNINELLENNNTFSLKLPKTDSLATLAVFPANILPDKIPPYLSVMVDGKLPEANDIVSPSPVLVVVAKDNIQLDSTRGIEIYQSECADCQLSLLNTTIKQHTPQQASVTATLTSPTKVYYLWIVARDKAGNVSEPYQINFAEISVAEAIPTTVSPIPAESYIKLNFLLASKTTTTEVKLIDAVGRQLTSNAYSNLPIGRNTLYVSREALATGIYWVEIWVDGQLFHKQRVAFN